MAFFTISMDFFVTSQLLHSSLRKSFSSGNSVFTVRSLFYGCLPKFNLHRVYPVATCFLSLYWNSSAADIPSNYLVSS